MWTETTTIHPTAWSGAVEADLARGLGLPVDDPTFMAACASARDQLATVAAPQSVTLSGDGTATLAPVEGI